MARLLARIVAAQDRWARPLGDFNHRWLKALFHPIRPVKDLLNGTWLGHPLHSAITDIPIGTLLIGLVFDVLDQRVAADVSLLATALFMLAAAVAGAADYVDTDGTARTRATLHSTLMVIALVLVRIGATVHALHAVCAHAGGPLAQGTVVDDCIQCPWHASRFRLEDGHVAQGPALYDQPVYEIQVAEGGGYEVRRAAT